MHSVAAEEAADYGSFYPLVLRLHGAIALTDDQVMQISALNHELRIELTAEGDLIVMPPAYAEAGERELEVGSQLRVWAERDGTGVAFGPSTGFRLPTKAIRSPDAAWVRRSRLAQLTPEEKEKFLPLSPDFAVEVRSSTDSLSSLQGKMREYLANGTELGWLIDPKSRRVEVYRPNLPVEVMDAPTEVAGGALLPGFVLELNRIWTRSW